MNKVEIELPFSGFYESLHDQMLQDELEQHFTYDHETGEDVPLTDELSDAIYMADINWQSIQEGYAKEYTEAFGEEFDLDLEFVEMTSPKYYNFSTDRIFAKIPLEQINKIREEVYAHSEWAQEVKDRYTDRDGFWSNFDPDVTSDDWTKEVLEPVQYRTMLEFWLENVNPNAHEDWDIYLMDDARGNGVISNLIDPAIDEVHKYLAKTHMESAIKTLNETIDDLKDQYGGEHNTPDFVYQAIKDLREAIKTLESIDDVTGAGK